MSARRLIVTELCLMIGAISIISGILAQAFALESDAARSDAGRVNEARLVDALPSQSPAATPGTDADSPLCPSVPAYESEGTQILAYYGSPLTTRMGILGELPPDEMIRRLKAHATEYDSLNGPGRVIPALDLVYATAQPLPGDDGTYLQYLDEATLREWVKLTCEQGLLLFLDLQIGQSSVAREVAKIAPLLGYKHVHVALDPEWAVMLDQVPGQDLGSIDAADVNAAQKILGDVARERGLPAKILIVHQFADEMLRRRELLAKDGSVRLVIDADGVGPAETKRASYRALTTGVYPAMKLFFNLDPNLMDEAEVLELDPYIIIYQ